MAADERRRDTVWPPLLESRASAAGWLADLMFLAAATLIAMVGTAAVCLITRQRVAAWLLLLFSAVWLPLNSTVEGAVIVRISDDHGITVADLLSIAGFVLAAAVLWSARPSAGSPRQRATSLLVASGILLAGVVVAYQY